MPFKKPQKIRTLSETVNENGNFGMKEIQYEENTTNHYNDSDSDDTEDDQLKPSNIHVFSASSTLHGFSHIFASHHSTLRRFSWSVAFLTSLTLFLLQVG